MEESGYANIVVPVYGVYRGLNVAFDDLITEVTIKIDHVKPNCYIVRQIIRST